MNELTHLDLFSGIGGMALGCEAAGFRTIAFAETDPEAVRVLAAHWPTVPNLGDVTRLCRRAYDCDLQDEFGIIRCPRCKEDFGDCACVGTDQFTDTYGFPDLITGGDPCQDNSNACRSAGALHASLGGEFLRIVSELQPRFVLRENPSVVRANAPWPWQRFALHLESLGYYTLPFRARACCVGAEHRRERLFVLAAFQDADVAGLERYERQILAGTLPRRHHPDLARPAGGNPASRICHRAHGLPRGLVKPALRCLGNAVLPQVVQAVAQTLISCLQP